ncbi:MAG: restriction endonuclease [Paracoccaceae bacterium]
MPVPDYQTLMLPVLRLLAEGRGSVKACLPDIIGEFDITDEEAAELSPSGRVTLRANRAHWARTYMSKAGLRRSPKRNLHEVTDTGRRLLAEQPARIDTSVLARFGAFKSWKIESAGGRAGGGGDGPTPDASLPGAAEPSQTPEERIRAAIDEVTASLADDRLHRLLQQPPELFERAVVDVLVAMGYGRGRDGAGRVLGKSGDGGIDGVINEDALGLDAVYVQAKRYAEGDTVGRPAIQQFVGSLTGEGATKGVFVTTSAFSKEAREYAARVQQRVVLIDGARLTRLMIAHGVGVRPVEAITLSEIDENFFAED